MSGASCLVSGVSCLVSDNSCLVSGASSDLLGDASILSLRIGPRARGGATKIESMVNPLDAWNLIGAAM